ncbi:LuxR C-terminal-related transcriptional regulator [Kribbella sp. NPDC050124]|uniref:LuxR C-terminal-related transcriptional regulator n=1 Tax=Kribbella sp. NPDC050124 TaxID=3364114 RepID=UPI0037ABBCF0
MKLAENRSERSHAHGRRHQAQMAGNSVLVGSARSAREAYLVTRGRAAEIIEIKTAGLRETLDAGESEQAAFYAGCLGRNLLVFGRFAEAERAIREGLALARAPHTSAHVRLAAALLSVRRGDLDPARSHLQRAAQLVPDLDERPGLEAPPTLAEYLVATGRPDRALEMLARTMAVQIADPRIVDDMVMWAARSAAEIAEHARDRRDGEGASNAQRMMDEIVGLRHDLQPPPFERITNDDLILPAIEALYIAETARCRALASTSAVWANATKRCAAAGLRWEEAVASSRWAQALLHEGASRAAIAAPLRSAHRLAVEMGAGPLRHNVETLAALGKISLDEPAAPSTDDVPDVFRSLTQREREILAYLVDGRTNAEIADELYISHKTVSVHVSNVLRKTDTSSRRDVSALATRLGYHHRSEGAGNKTDPA